MINNEISLLGLYKTLEDIKKTYGQKINYLSSVFDTKSRLPDGVSNDNDGPGLWPDAGITVYRIIPQHVLAYSYCSSGIIVNFASDAMRFQLMLVEHNDLYPERDGRIYVRYANIPVDAWTDWRLVMNTDDVTDLTSGNVKVGASKTADTLTTPRVISVGGAMTGSAVFDGSENIVINVDSEGFVPLNIRHDAAHYESKTALHVLSLPANDGSVHAHAVIHGHVGGWRVDQGQATINLDISRRDGDLVNSLIIGNLGNVDIVCVNDLTTNELRVYLEFTGYVGACELSVYGDQVTVVDQFVGTPIYTTTWRASTDATYINGTRTNLAPDVTVGTAEVAEKITAVQNSAGSHYLATVDANGTINYHPSMTVNHNTQTISASKFIGNLQGTATTAAIAQTANAITSREMASTRAPILAGNGMAAIYDAGIYLENEPGVLCATTVRSDKHEVTRIDADHIEAKTINLSTSATAPDFIGHLQGNADTATLAATVTVTEDTERKAALTAHIGTTLYADAGVYLTATPGQLYANDFKSVTGHMQTIELSTSATAPDFIGHLQGNADTATLAATVTVTENSMKQVPLVAHDDTTLYSDSGVYLTTNIGQLYANNFSGVSANLQTIVLETSATAPDFIGHLQGNADTATRATTAVVTSNNTIEAPLVANVNGTLYDDSAVYLTSTPGELHCTILSADTLVGTTAKIVTDVPQLSFHFNSSAEATHVLKAVNATTLDCSTDFTAARVYNAVWNDYAEWFPRGGETEPGDVVAIDLSRPGELYVRAHEGCTCVVGVHSDEYGHIVGGEQPPMGMDFNDYNMVKFIPVALAGRVRVKFVGPAKRGVRVVPAADGAARVFADGDDPATVIGMLVEDDTRTDVRRLRIKLR